MTKNKFNKLLTKLFIILMVFIIGTIYKKEQKIIEYEKDTLNSELSIYFFDVGQADSILIKEDDYEVLIDGGNVEDGTNLANYLKNELNINNIDIVVGTHPHEDHIGGLPNIINSIDIDKIYLPNVTTTTKTFENLLDSIDNNDYKITVPKINEEIKLNNMVFKVIYSGTDEDDLNNSGVVLKLIYGNTSYLFTGDIEEKIENIIINKDIKSDVLKIGHHGSNNSTSNNFLNKVNPKHAIISVGKNNKYDHPHKEIIDRLSNKNINIYRTDIDGTIKLTSDGNKINIEKLNINLNG